ncbi:MAG: baseplate assembly protein V, partial [Clostridia bacterium]|nr:baseplate assembly protein V [Clostridia bacterium]
AEQIRLTDKAGQVVRMNAAPGQESISATDKSGSLVFMDGVAGNIIIRSTNTVLINT